MVADASQEHLERDAVVQVLAGVDLEAGIDAGAVEGVEQRPPALGQLVERGLDQTGGALRPRVEIGPRQRAGERRVGGEPEPPRSLCRLH